jgi:hypothetical protein
MPIGVNKHNVILNPGNSNFFVNLMSDLFAQPIGLLVIIQDLNELAYGMFYLENCYPNSLQFGVDAQGIIIQEATTLDVERVVPLSSDVMEFVQLVDEKVLRKLEEVGSITAAQ